MSSPIILLYSAGWTHIKPIDSSKFLNLYSCTFFGALSFDEVQMLDFAWQSVSKMKARRGKHSELKAPSMVKMWVWINTYKNTIFRGMNIHKSQLFWCELQGYKVLTHCHIALLTLAIFRGGILCCHVMGLDAKAWGCCKICENFEHARLCGANVG